MKKQNKPISRKFLVSSSFILLLVLFIFSALQGYSNLKFHSKNFQANSLDIIDQRMSSVLIEVNVFPRSAGNDILFLSRLSSLKNIINEEENHIDELRDFAIWLTGCGYDFCQHEYFCKQRDKLLKNISTVEGGDI